MKKIIILSVVFLSIALAQPIDKALEKKLQQNSQELIPIIVTMKDRILVSEISNLHTTKRDDIAVLMENKAKQSQHWLKSLCKSRNFQVRDYRSFWIANMVSMKTSATAIKEIALQSDVAEIFLDEEHLFVDYLKSEQQVRSTWGLE